MTTIEALALEQELLQASLVRTNLRVDSVLQSMKEQSISVNRMVTTLNRIIKSAYSDKNIPM